MAETPYEYDLAFSFLAQDEQHLRKRIIENLLIEGVNFIAVI
jgi:hypothetical protein